MVKRKRNRVGQFISSASTYIGPKAGFLEENYFQKVITVFMALFFVLVVSPWLTLAIKSKKLKDFFYALFQFYSKHFISEDELNGGFCSSKKGDI